MASFTINGHIESIKYTESSVFVFVSEVCCGYRDSSGRVVDNEVLMWRIIFPKGMRSYISKYFSKGMLVNIYGIPKPYAKDGNGNRIEGVTILGKNIDRAAYQRTTTRMEKKMVEESLLNSEEQPDFYSYQEPDF